MSEATFSLSIFSFFHTAYHFINVQIDLLHLLCKRLSISKSFSQIHVSIIFFFFFGSWERRIRNLINEEKKRYANIFHHYPTGWTSTLYNSSNGFKWHIAIGMEKGSLYIIKSLPLRISPSPISFYFVCKITFTNAYNHNFDVQLIGFCAIESFHQLLSFTFHTWILRSNLFF